MIDHRLGLEEIDGSGANRGQVPVWNPDTGCWEPGTLDPTTTKGDLIVRGAAVLGRLGGGTDGQVLTWDSAQPFSMKWATAGGGGSVSAWTKNVDNPLTSLTGFTSLTGTWGAGSGQIAQTGTATQYNRLRYDTRTPRALGAAEVEVRYDSGGSGTTRAAGLLVAFDGVAASGVSGGLSVYLLSSNSGSTWAVRAESDGWTGLVTSTTVSFTPGTYARLSVVNTAAGVDVYLNGTYLFTAYNNDTSTTHRTADVSYVGLVTYSATATFRNLKAWGVTPPF